MSLSVFLVLKSLVKSYFIVRRSLIKSYAKYLNCRIFIELNKEYLK